MSDVVKHEEKRTVNAQGAVSVCSCGAHWSHPKDRPAELMDSIFVSHVRYFERETVTL